MESDLEHWMDMDFIWICKDSYTNASEAYRLSNGGREEEDAEARRIGLRNCIGPNAHRMIGRHRTSKQTIFTQCRLEK